MYQRLLAYLSLAFYSISNQLINANQNKEAEYFVDLIRRPIQPTARHGIFLRFSTPEIIMQFQLRQILFKAAENGFTDKDRMLRQPEFIKLSSQINLPAVESKMKSGD
jgi:hypothetical protein